MTAPVEHTCPRCRSTWLPRIAQPVRCPRCQAKLARARPVEPVCRCGHAWDTHTPEPRTACQAPGCACWSFSPVYASPVYRIITAGPSAPYLTREQEADNA